MSGEPLIARGMTTKDVDAVMALAAELPSAPHWSRETYLRAVNPDNEPLRIGVVAERAGEIVGFVMASLMPPEAELETIAVAKKAQREGIGRLLLEQLTARLLGAGADRILLEVRASNLPAAEFYRSTGFVETGRRRSYYTDPVEDAVLMKLGLE